MICYYGLYSNAHRDKVRKKKALPLSFLHNILCEYISSPDFFVLTTRFRYDIGFKGYQRAEIG